VMKTTHSCQTDTNEKMTPKLGLLGIGTEVMRQFDEGLFVGTVQSYDRKDKLYTILYSDGDKEDMDEEEYVYAYQLALTNGGDANDHSSRDSADEESAYQLPKKKVNLIYLRIYLWSYIYLLSITVYLLGQNQEDTSAR
jgi:hypothetical protein